MCVCACASHPAFSAGFKGDLTTQLIKQRKKDLATTRHEAPSSTALVDDEETEGGGEGDDEEEEDTPEPDDGLPRVKDIAQVRFCFVSYSHIHSTRCQAIGTAKT